MKNIIGIIPARMASTRLPGKPLVKILGIPMLGHVYHRSKMSKVLKEVYIASCDGVIEDFAKSIGAKHIMTKDSHERASDRTAEAMLKIEEETGEKLDIVVMIQGDEPMLRPEMINLAIEPLLNSPSIQVVNLMTPLQTIEEHSDPNEVKVVVDRDNFALYFSREPLPFRRNGVKDIPMLKQVCIIPFRRNFLLKFNELEPTPLEKIESVDMLRVLEHRDKVKMVLSESQTYSVDTFEDLKRVEKLMMEDSLVKQYGKF